MSPAGEHQLVESHGDEERRRAWWRHEQQTVRMALVAATQRAAERRPAGTEDRRAAEGEVHETAPGGATAACGAPCETACRPSPSPLPRRKEEEEEKAKEQQVAKANLVSSSSAAAPVRSAAVPETWQILSPEFQAYTADRFRGYEEKEGGRKRSKKKKRKRRRTTSWCLVLPDEYWILLAATYSAQAWFDNGYLFIRDRLLYRVLWCPSRGRFLRRRVCHFVLVWVDFFFEPLYLAVNCSTLVLPEECLRGFFWEMLPDNSVFGFAWFDSGYTFMSLYRGVW